MKCNDYGNYHDAMPLRAAAACLRTTRARHVLEHGDIDAERISDEYILKAQVRKGTTTMLAHIIATLQF